VEAQLRAIIRSIEHHGCRGIKEIRSSYVSRDIEWTRKGRQEGNAGMPMIQYVRRMSFGNGRNDAAALSVADFPDDEI